MNKNHLSVLTGLLLGLNCGLVSADTGQTVYEGVCVSCHGSGIPGIPQFGDASAWSERIKLGKETLYEHALLGFTGKSGMPMPARGGNSELSDDEVKAAVDYMIAHSEEGAQVETTSSAATSPGKQSIEACAACHGADGNSTNSAWPKLAGQHVDYIIKQLNDFKEGKRSNPLMSPVAENLTEQDMQSLADTFSSKEIKPGQANPEKLVLGKKIYRAGNSDAGVPACLACHGPTGRGNPAAKYPALAGQHAEYTEMQLNAFRSDTRTNDANAAMRNVVDRMSDDEIKAVSQYIQGLH